MFNFSDSSFEFYFDRSYDIRRDGSGLAFRGGIQATAESSLAVRLALTGTVEPTFDMRLSLAGEQAVNSAMQLGLCDISRLAWRLALLETECSSMAMLLGLAGALSTDACVVLRVRKEERFTN